jgi:hypothetical protein
MDYGIGACHGIDMLGRSVNICHPDTASGRYMASDEAVVAMDAAGTNKCAPGMRPGWMRIKGLPATDNNPEGLLLTCNGVISQEDMPDMNIIDWPYRIVADMLLVMTIALLIGGIALKISK